MGIMIRDAEALAMIDAIARRDGIGRTEALKIALRNAVAETESVDTTSWFPRDRVVTPSWTL